MTIAEQNQRIAAYLAEHKELDLQKKYSDRKNDEKARTAFDQMTNDGVERKFDCIIVASMWAIPSTIKVHRSYSQDKTSAAFRKNSGMWQRTHIRPSSQGMILKRCKKSWTRIERYSIP